MDGIVLFPVRKIDSKRVLLLTAVEFVRFFDNRDPRHWIA